MKIAVTYENGQVFQHFGHTETFKVYEVDDGKIIQTELIGSNGSGHGALAGLLNDQAINVLICGGIGGGAQAALSERGIELCAGAAGNADEAVAAYLRGEPLEFVCGAGMMIKGFDAAVANMEVGQIVDVHLMPSEAYGERDPAAIFTVETARLPGAEELLPGQRVYLQNSYGQPFPVKVTAKDATTITFDANHEMAGKELNFRIELVEVIDQEA